MTATVLSTKICEVENKTPNTSRLANTTVLNATISEVENKIADHDILLLLNLINQQQKILQQD